MKILITQPTFLPWIGYFDLIEKSDLIVFFDDVQFDKRSWQQRNQIKTANGLEWLSIPVFTKGKRFQKIKDVKINIDENFFSKVKTKVQLNYNKSKYYNTYYNDFIEILEKTLSTKNLLTINLKLIEFFIKTLRLKKKIILSSELNIKSSRSKKIIEICNYFNVKNYISTNGSLEYLKNDFELFKTNQIKIFLHKYDHPQYNQSFSPFKPYASILDLIFNEGNNSLKILNVGKLIELKLDF
jgi:hypothetical protein